MPVLVLGRGRMRWSCQLQEGAMPWPTKSGSRGYPGAREPAFGACVGPGQTGALGCVEAHPTGCGCASTTCAWGCYPQVRLNLSKLTVTVPLAFMTNTVVSCAVIDEPS